MRDVAVKRAFIVEEGPSVPAREAVEAARAAGHVPDVFFGGCLIGEGPREHLDPVEVTGEQLAQLCDRRRLPRWVVAKNPLSSGFVQTKALMRTPELVTVCEEAACPNIGKCWSRGTATFMIAGSRCTRGCRFCNVMTAKPMGPPDPDEPRRVAEAAASMGLRFVVVTAVARDDLPDGGAEHFRQTIEAVRSANPGIVIEVLVPDFLDRDASIDIVLSANPEIYNHNLETVRRLTPSVRSRATYDRSLSVLRKVKERRGDTIYTKSGVMLGLVETEDELFTAMHDLREVKCDILTLGQYLQPTLKHLPVGHFVSPDRFAAYGERARQMGFLHVASGPMVRSSYHADEVGVEGLTSMVRPGDRK